MKRMKKWPRNWRRRIIMDRVPYANMRYESAGDYKDFKNDVTKFAVAHEMGEMSCYAVFIHELVEYVLTKIAGISEESISAFDLAVPDDSPYADDPGWDPKCVYHTQHMQAEMMERLFCGLVGLSWKEHTKNVDNLGDEDWKGSGC